MKNLGMSLILLFVFVVGCSPVNKAAKNGDIDAVRFWIDAGGDIDGKDNAGKMETPLILATINGHSDMVDYLIMRGADVNEKGKGWYSALYLAAAQGREEILRTLLEHGAKIEAFPGKSTALDFASRYGQAEMVRILIYYGGDVNHISIYGETPLCEAVMGRDWLLKQRGTYEGHHTETIRILLENGANPNPAFTESSPLCIACSRNYTEAIDLLTKYGAKADVTCCADKPQDDTMTASR